MKVIDLLCAQGHGFEGWFASEMAFESQREAHLVSCPVCGESTVKKCPSAPRLHLQGTKSPNAEPVESEAAAAQLLTAAWLELSKHIAANTTDVGAQFAREARRMHYDEVPKRGIRGTATQKELLQLNEEGIETLSFVAPPVLQGPLH